MDEYLIPTQFGEAEFVEKKSRFIGRVWPVDTEEEALAKIQEMKKKHYDATHNCWAYIIRDGAVRFSDDGEPGGTAGMPMLQVLQREGLFNVVCVVTRYFGGILLGAGGLVRAYTKGTKIAVDAAGKSMKRVWTAVYVPCPYPFYERVKLEVAAFGGILRKTDFGAEVELELTLPGIREAEPGETVELRRMGLGLSGTYRLSEVEILGSESQGALTVLRLRERM